MAGRLKSKAPGHNPMAYISGARNYPVEIDSEDLQFRCYTAMHVAGLTVRDVADYMGIRQQYVLYAVEGRRYYMNLQFLVNFCAICRCSIADLLPFVNDIPPFPHRFTVVGGGAVAEITPDPYRITFTNPEELGEGGWNKESTSEVSSE